MHTIRTVFTLGAVLAARTATAECLATTDTGDLAAALETAEDAYADLDVARFKTAMDDARLVLPCLEDPITRHLAAELHRFEGLQAFIDRTPDRSIQAFAAARSIQPNYRFPESLVPSGNPVLEDYEALDPSASDLQPVGEPVRGAIHFDGRASTQRAKDYPTVVQLSDATGQVTVTDYLWPGDPLPAYEARPIVAVPLPAPGDQGGGTGNGGSAITVIDRGPNMPLLAGAGAGLAASGLVYGAAFLVHKRYDDPETSFEDLNRLRSTNNGLVMASGAVAVVSVGLGASAFFVARW